MYINPSYSDFFIGPPMCSKSSTQLTFYAQLESFWLADLPDGFPLLCRAHPCGWFPTCIFWSALSWQKLFQTVSDVFFLSFRLKWTCSCFWHDVLLFPPFLECVHSWALCAWVCTAHCVYALVQIDPMMRFRQCIWEGRCCAWCLGFSSQAIACSSWVASAVEDSNTLRLSVRGKQDPLPHNKIRKFQGIFVHGAHEVRCIIVY